MELSSSSTAPRKYDVFLSFRGEDTRGNFISHLYDALIDKKIVTFIDNNLVRGEEISPSLLKAIEDSKISVIVLSENYAFSKWCLEELAKIIQCMKTNGQMVIPVFYQVNPSNVRNQMGSFQDAFAVHEESLMLSRDKVCSWRAALKEVANLSGWDSNVIRPESTLIKEILNDIMKKLNHISPSYSTGLVGIDSRIEQIESLLCTKSLDVRIVGIWGMGGIGKTTLAKAVYDHISTQFESSYFLSHFREQSKRKLSHLRDELFSKILGDESQSIHSVNLGLAYIQDRIRRKKVIIVVDDADNSTQLQQLLATEYTLFGSGTKILITSRDKQVLKNVVDVIYKMKGLNQDEALHLFSLNAFKQNYPTTEHLLQAERVVTYAKGNPLALKVLGSALFDKSQEDWRSALERLENVHSLEIHNVLRISYDGLESEEKRIFLDVAIFFRRGNRDHVTKILEGYYSSVHFTISTLIDKSLILVSWDNKLEMHDLLEEMGRKIIEDESIKPENRSRLWNSEEIRYVLMEKKGTEATEGISLDMSEAREMCLECDSFAGMNNLRYLKFHEDHTLKGRNKVLLPKRGLRFFPRELRYLHWFKSPLKTLPPKICAENLVVIELPHSNIKKLWTGVQHLVKLKVIDLSGSKYLTRIPNLSMAINLERIDLRSCSSLVELHSSVQYLLKLQFLYLQDCCSLSSLPRRIDSKVIEVLDLSLCRKVKRMPEIICWEFLKTLGLSFMSRLIKFPDVSAIESESGLQQLSLAGCSRLLSLPSSIYKLKSLNQINLLACLKLESFPEVLDPMMHIRTINMEGCRNLKKLPNSICNLKSLNELRLYNCSKLESFPEILEPMEYLHRINLGECRNLKKLPDSICNLKSLQYLNLNGTAILEIPSTIEHLHRLEELHLSDCKYLVNLPSCIHKLSKLRTMLLTLCKSLCSLPALPPFLISLEASNCKSLEKISSSFSKCNRSSLNFTNCSSLDQKAAVDLMADAQLRIQYQSRIQHQLRIQHAPRLSTEYTKVELLVPGSEIPGWFSHQSVGSSIEIELPLTFNELAGIAYCIVIGKTEANRVSRSSLSFIQLDSQNNQFFAYSKMYDTNRGPQLQDEIWSTSSVLVPLYKIESDHVVIWYDCHTLYKVLDVYSGKVASLNFYIREMFGTFYEVKKCGFCLLE